MRPFRLPRDCRSRFILALVVVVAMGPFAEARAAIAPDAEALLARVRVAAGATAWRRVVAVETDGRLTASGMEAAYRADEDVRAGRFDQRLTFPHFTQREVWDGAHGWKQDQSGGVHRLDGAFAVGHQHTDAWLARRGWLLPDAGQAYVGPVSTRQLDGRPVAVVDAIPPGGQPVALMFDETTLDLVGTERVMPTSVEEVAFDDYRVVDGVRLPFAIVTRDDGDTESLQITAYRLLATASSDRFQAPRTPDDWTLPGGPVTVPFDLRNGVLTIEAKIDGKGPFRFIFDTGGHAIVSPALAEALHLDVTGAGQSGGAGEGTVTDRYTRVARVEIGGLVLKDQAFYVIDLGYPTWERGRAAPIDGLLGVELLERLAVRFDYPARVVTFAPFASHRFDPAAVVAPLRFDDDIPLVDGTLDGQLGVFALDTGNASGMVVQHLWAERVGLATALKRGIETASFGAGGVTRNWISRSDRFTIGGRSFDHIATRYAEDRRGAFSSRTEAGNIGTQVLANFVVDLDYREGRIGWRYVPGYVPPPFNRGGLRALKDRPEDFVVVVVADGSPGFEAGVRAKDRIVAVDGVSSAELSGADFNEIFARPPGTIVHLDLVRDGHPSKAAVTLRELLP